ncbi:MAG: DUF177 domain-containing protein [Desulfovibrionaceae bacterium]|nr:DUF177 domain-containing protein [Desulfovibrionaceae bacterium]
MSDLWIAVGDLPAEGREFSFSDQGFWTKALKAFDLSCSLAGPLEASVLIRPQGDGVLVSGRLSGLALVPCDRCAEPFEQPVKAEFTGFEGRGDQDGPGEARLREQGGALELNIGAVLWEQFVLALPVKPLCSESCRGLCPGCGKNLNTEVCSCKTEKGDPRLAALRKLKLS